ncbi:hypothetical protein V493_05371 [Pseudogymnoascus sp. VKM F-4281 (FW-2241)]|nr:hypothetical protein V493_05371 [Pseudogymnoascus sp. VKM F-4281 (FW-2241)]
METLAYWVARLEPLIRCEDDGEIIIVLANRTGVEGDAVYSGTSAVLGIQNGEVKLYGVLGRGERELLVVDTSKRPQAKLVSDPSIPARTRGLVGMSGEGTRTLGGQQNESCDPRKSKSIQGSIATLIEPEDIQPSIDEILAGGISMSPVEPLSHVFFGSNPTKPEDRHTLKSITVENVSDEPQALKSSKDETYQALKSAVNGINRKDNSTPSPEAGGFDRPSSPKSRNASRTRQAVHQEQALYTHDLAGVELQTKRATSRNGMGSAETLRGPVQGQVLNSSSLTMDIILGGDHEGTDSLMPIAASEMTLRPKSTGW